MGTVNTNHYVIMDYWRDKAICKNGDIITEDEAGRRRYIDTIPVIKDWGEPMCWGCSKPIIGDYEKKCESESYDEDDIKKLWLDKKVKSKLNRCHIVPASLDGEDRPENLFLMCESCHILSPDSRNKEGFFRWVYRQRQSMDMGRESVEETMRLVNNELVDRGLPTSEEMFAQRPNMNMNDGESYLRSRVSTHGSKLATSSLIVAFADWIEKEYRSAMVKKIDAMR